MANDVGSHPRFSYSWAVCSAHYLDSHRLFRYAVSTVKGAGLPFGDVVVQEELVAVFWRDAEARYGRTRRELDSFTCPLDPGHRVDTLSRGYL